MAKRFGPRYVEECLRSMYERLPADAPAVKGVSRGIQANPRRRAEIVARITREAERFAHKRNRDANPAPGTDDSVIYWRAPGPFENSDDRDLADLFRDDKEGRGRAAHGLGERLGLVSKWSVDFWNARKVRPRGLRVEWLLETVNDMVSYALITAADELLAGRRDDRIGKQHVVGLHGKRVAYDARDLRPDQLEGLLEQRAHEIFRSLVLEDPIPTDPEYTIVSMDAPRAVYATPSLFNVASDGGEPGELNEPHRLEAGDEPEADEGVTPDDGDITRGDGADRDAAHELGAELGFDGQNARWAAETETGRARYLARCKSDKRTPDLARAFVVARRLILHPELAKRVTRKTDAEAKARRLVASLKRNPSAVNRLTDLQKQVALGIARHEPATAIAERLGRKPGTVRVIAHRLKQEFAV